MTKTSETKTATRGDEAPATARQDNGTGSPETKLKELRQRLLEISDLGAAGAVLGWDQATYMPKDGARAGAPERHPEPARA